MIKRSFLLIEVRHYSSLENFCANKINEIALEELYFTSDFIFQDFLNEIGFRVQTKEQCYNYVLLVISLM
jgi:hypothetical protein